MVLQCGGETNVALSLAEAQRGSLQGEQSEAGPQGAHRGNGVRDLKTTQSSRSIFQRCFSLALRSPASRTRQENSFPIKEGWTFRLPACWFIESQRWLWTGLA